VNKGRRMDPVNDGRVVRTEGQRRLLAVALEPRGIVAALGASKAAVSQWRSGQKVPGREWRAKLEAAFGIPASAWDRVAGSTVPVAARPAAAPASPPARPAAPVPSRGAETMGQVNELLEALDEERQDSGLTAAERARVCDAYTKALALKARLEREAELLEDRVVREHPFWARIRGALVDALRAHPAAARDVADALGRLGA